MATYVVVGGGLAALRGAEQLRRSDADAEIVMFSEETSPPYDRPPLSKEYLRGDWDLERITLAKGDTLTEQRIDMRLGARVEAIDCAAHTVRLADGAVQGYDKLLYATGGRIRELALPGTGLAGVHYFRTLADADAIKAAAAPGTKAVIIGAGFIGVELAASLAKLGCEVTVLEVTSYIWSRFLDEELATYIQGRCQDQGVRFLTSMQPTAINGDGGLVRSVAYTGGELPATLVCIGVGILPNVELAESAGLQVQNGVVVDECMQTSNPDVFAAGDIINYPDPIFKKRRRVEHWGHAEYTGALAAQNMAGEHKPYDLLSYVWSDVFDMHLEFAGEEKDFDQMVIRGVLADGAFTVLYLKGGALQAYLGVNAPPREFRVLQRLIREQAQVADKLEGLRDRATDLRALFS
ncbi:MAG: NAD(P)/FAD-dependent oxidoreductase [Dehalococcoidia bacterium]|nr:NAD(P)/FAD-dependent oxidoreductase [Dehalococcoidia bacterium]